MPLLVGCPGAGGATAISQGGWRDQAGLEWEVREAVQAWKHLMKTLGFPASQDLGGGHGFHFIFGICFAKRHTGPSGSRKRTSSKGGNVLKLKLHSLLSLPHQRLISLNAPVCRHLLS